MGFFRTALVQFFLRIEQRSFLVHCFWPSLGAKRAFVYLPATWFKLAPYFLSGTLFHAARLRTKTRQ